jgi:hypothetical protein
MSSSSVWKNKAPYLLLLTITLLYLFTVLLTNPVTDFSSDPLFVLRNLSPLFWVATAASVISLILLLKFDNLSNKTGICLAAALLIPLCIDLSFRFIVAFPLSRELFHSAGMFYILEHGSSNFPAYMIPETIAPRMIGAIFTLVTGLDPVIVVNYLPALFYPFLFSLFAYVVARKLQISKPLSMLGAVYGVALYFIILGMDRSTYCLPLYLLSALPILSLVKPYSSRSHAVVLLLLLSALVISDIQFLMLMPTLALIPLLLYLGKATRLGNAEDFTLSKRFINSAVLTFTAFIGWSLFVNPTTVHLFDVPGVILNRFITSLTEGTLQPSYVVGYTPTFSFFSRTIGVLTTGAIVLSTILLIIFLTEQIRRRPNLGVFSFKNLAVLIAFFLPTTLLALAGNKRTALIWISLLTVYVLNYYWHKLDKKTLTKTLSIGVLSFMFIVILLSPTVTWATSETFISVKETKMLAFLGSTLPENMSVIAIHERGDLQPGLNYFFANRENINVQNFIGQPSSVLFQQALLDKSVSSYPVIMVGSILHSSAIYNVDMHTYILTLINMTDSQRLNLVYTSGDPYYVFLKS